jgi:hypothetical protein
METIHQLQLNLPESLWKLQDGMPMELEEVKTNAPSTSTNLLPKKHGPSSTLSPIPLHPTISVEPKVSLPNKFDGTKECCRGFINQIKLIIQLQPQWYFR